MDILASILNPAPYHVLFYGTLLGSSIFQSFVGGIVSFRVLPRPQFSTLQQNQFPIYFGMQTILPALLILTAPRPLGSTSSTTGLLAALDEKNRWSVLVPLVAMGLCGAINWLALGPMTTTTIRKRKHQETKDGKKYYEAGPHSDEMKALNKRFGMQHGFSSLVNLFEIIVTITYGVILSKRLQ